MLNTQERSELRQRLIELTRTRALGSDLRELAGELAAELAAAERGATPDSYLAHNLGALAASLESDPASAGLGEALATSAAGFLARSLAADGDDLVLAHALALSRAPLDDEGVARLVGALERPHAGDRLTVAVARALAARDGGRGRTSSDGKATEAVLGKLDAILAREPERETLAEARLELLVGQARAGQRSALERIGPLLEDAERTFGGSPERDLLRLEVAGIRAAEREGRFGHRDVNDALTLAEAVASGPLQGMGGRDPIGLLGALQRGLLRRKLLSGDVARRLAGAWHTLENRRPDSAEARAGRQEALEHTGDVGVLLDHHVELVRSGQATADSRTFLARTWFGRLNAGEPSGLPTEVEAWLLESITPDAAKSLHPEAALLLLRNVAADHGPELAGRLGADALLKVKSLARAPELVVAVVQTLADAGDPERALDVGHRGLEHAGSSTLRLSLAKIHMGAGIRFAEAEPLLRAVAADGGPLAHEARALRDEVVQSAEFEASRRDAMIEVEKRLGVGSKKPIRARVLHGSDKFVLAELPGGRAPAFYPHWYLRVMVRDQDLPDGVNVASLTKGTELAVPVRGEDDYKSDRVRVYWVDGGKATVIARAPSEAAQAAPAEPATPSGGRRRGGGEESQPDEAVEAPTPELEAAFNIGAEAPARVRIDQYAKRSQLLFGRVLPPDGSDGDVFPVRVGIKVRFIPEGTQLAELNGAVVSLKVVRGPGDKLRYDGASELTIVTPSPIAPQGDDTAPDGAAPGAPSADAAAPEASTEAPTHE